MKCSFKAKTKNGLTALTAAYLLLKQSAVTIKLSQTREFALPPTPLAPPPNPFKFLSLSPPPPAPLCWALENVRQLSPPPASPQWAAGPRTSPRAGFLVEQSQTRTQQTPPPLAGCCCPQGRIVGNHTLRGRIISAFPRWIGASRLRDSNGGAVKGDGA